MDHCDVAIVGGGPAGSSCARRLCAAGLDVVIVDKAVFPRDKVCAGWITPEIVQSLEMDLGEYCAERQEPRGCDPSASVAGARTLQPFTGFITGLIGGPEVRTDYPQPVSYGIRRCEFDAYLLHRCGARLRWGEALQTLRAEPDGWIVNESLRAPLVIGAGGHFCPVARLLAETDPALGDPVVLAQEVEFALSTADAVRCPVAGSHPELYFCPDLAGYGWIVRKGNYLNIGLGREHERNLSTHLEQFLEFLRARNRLIVDIPQPFRGHAYTLRKHVPPMHLPDRVLLIGDAAGLAYPQSGEGIRPAIESGLLAAETILAARGHYAGSLWQRYRQQCDARFGRGKSRTNWLPQPFKQFAASRLMQTGWFNRHVLLNRWFLHAQQPAL
jgi:flavin-dependent dehydrogenase